MAHGVLGLICRKNKKECDIGKKAPECYTQSPMVSSGGSLGKWSPETKWTLEDLLIGFRGKQGPYGTTCIALWQRFLPHSARDIKLCVRLKVKNNKLNCLVGGISRQHTIHTVTWLLLSALRHVNSEEQEKYRF